MENTTGGAALPPGREAEVRGQLAPDESVLGWFEPDLDHRLHYARGVVVLTDQRILADGAGNWESWGLEEGVTLRPAEHGGAGALELLGPEGRLAWWNYTAARAAGAQKLAHALGAWRARRDGGPAPDAGVCPSCGAVSPDGGLLAVAPCAARARSPSGTSARGRRGSTSRSSTSTRRR